MIIYIYLFDFELFYFLPDHVYDCREVFLNVNVTLFSKQFLLIISHTNLALIWKVGLLWVIKTVDPFFNNFRLFNFLIYFIVDNILT